VPIKRLLITGAAGKMATLVNPLLVQADRTLRLLDVREPSPIAGAEVVLGSVLDRPLLDSAMAGVDAVIHLAGQPSEADWPRILSLNIDGTQSVLDAARRNRVGRVVLASSNHAVGFFSRPPDGDAPDGLVPQPDTYYGVSKAAVEALGSLYHDRYGMDVVCVRIGSCLAEPRDVRMLSTWLSPADCARLFEATISAPAPGFQVVWGVSANTRRWWSLDAARALGYQPADDAEEFADRLMADPDAAESELDRRYVGGGFCSPSLNQQD
jgi:uronate dehydrogenase